MNFLKDSIALIIKKWPISLFTAALGLLLGIIPSLFFSYRLSVLVKTQKALEELAYQFNFGLLTDFLHLHSKELIPYLGYGMSVGFIGSLFFTYLSAGVIDQLHYASKKINWRSFFYVANQLFGKYLLLLIMLGLLLFSIFLVSGLVYFIFYLIADGSTERGYTLWLSIPTLFLVAGFSFGLTLSFYAKVMLYQNRHLTASKAFWASFSYVFKHPQTLIMAAFIGLLSYIPRIIHGFLEQYVGMYGWTKVIGISLFVILGLFIRFALKNLQYAFAINYYQKHALHFPLPIPIINESQQTEASLVHIQEDIATAEEEIPEELPNKTSEEE